MSDLDSPGAPGRVAFPRSPIDFPSLQRSATYTGTGALAGCSILPIELAWARYVHKTGTPLGTHLRQIGPTLIGRAAVRFGVFDVVKGQIERNDSASKLPVWMKGAVSGASGGFAEICAQAFVSAKLPDVGQLGLQTTRLFFAFGTYTYLSTSFSQDGPPSPALLCWACGAAAGTVASTAVGLLERVRPSLLVKDVIPKGALVIGTTIAVQVISCDAIIRRLRNA